jgi:hypothetical protein
MHVPEVVCELVLVQNLAIDPHPLTHVQEMRRSEKTGPHPAAITPGLMVNFIERLNPASKTCFPRSSVSCQLLQPTQILAVDAQ